MYIHVVYTCCICIHAIVRGNDMLKMYTIIKNEKLLANYNCMSTCI